MPQNLIRLSFFVFCCSLSQQVSLLEHETEMGRHNSIVQVDSDTYALAYSDENEKGWIATFTISSNGPSITEISSLKHNNNQGLYNSLVQVDSDTYLLAYTGPDNDGFISSFTISSDGTSITEIVQLEHQTSHAEYNSLVQIDSDTYALAYSGPDDDGFITTFTVPSNGSSITEVATIEHNTSDASYNSLIQVDSDTYVLAYSGTNEDGFIATFTISSNGATITEVDEIEHDTDKGRHNSIVQIDSDTYALAYEGLNSDGFIKTFSVQSDGTLPVELTSFELLETRNEGITLQWITESEINNLGFNLDRKTPITDWNQIDSYITHPELQGQVSVSHQTIYTFTDNTVQENESYDYRLSDVDYDGNVEYHSLQVMGVSSSNMPEQFILYPNYPNPFNPVTTIRYDLPEDGNVSLVIHDVTGSVIRQLVKGRKEAGHHRLTWDGTNDQGRKVSAGIYLCSIRNINYFYARKIILVK